MRIHLREEASLNWAKRKVLRRFFTKVANEDGVTYQFSPTLEACMNLNPAMLLQAKEYEAKMRTALEDNGATKTDYSIEQVTE